MLCCLSDPCEHEVECYLCLIACLFGVFLLQPCILAVISLLNTISFGFHLSALFCCVSWIAPGSFSSAPGLTYCELCTPGSYMDVAASGRPCQKWYV
jgi:hypothetical protein